MAAITIAQRQRECNRIQKCKWPRGDPESCFKILDLHGTAARRVPANITVAGLMAHVNTKLELIALHHWWPGTTANDSRYTNLARGCTLKILHALQTLGPYRNFQWIPNTELPYGTQPWRGPIVITAQDIPIRLDPAIVGVPATPMTFAAHRAHYSALPNEPKKPAGTYPFWIETNMWSPTPKEIPLYDHRRWEDWWYDTYGDGGGPYEGYPRTEQYGIGHNDTTVTAHGCAGDGNCYWYAIAISLYGIDDVWRFSEVKANIRTYFMGVLNNSSHPRYNTYVHFEANSRVRDTRPEVVNNPMGNYGETSLTRSLHRNANPGGYISKWRPRPTNNLPGQPQPGYSLNQIVADYYDVCVVELEESEPVGEDFDSFNVAGQLAREWDTVAFRGDMTKRWIYIFNESEHFHACFRPNHYNDAGNFDPPALEDKLDEMPWHPANGPRPADDLLPLPANLRHPAVVAPQMEIDHVIANRDVWWVNLPEIPPPGVRDYWVSQHPTVPPFPVLPEFPRVVARLGHPPLATRGLP